MSNNTDNEEEIDKFLDVVGVENDPVVFFFNALKECGCNVTEENGQYKIENPCPNLVTHSSNGHCELLCTHCYIALDIEPIDIPPVKSDNSSNKDEGDDDDDDEALDAFLDKVGTESGDYNYPGLNSWGSDDSDSSDDDW